MTEDLQKWWEAKLASGRLLGTASGGSPSFWDGLGEDDAGMPLHLPMGVTQDGRGPENDSEAHHWICWCGDVECPLSLALIHAWKSGRLSEGHIRLEDGRHTLKGAACSCGGWQAKLGESITRGFDQHLLDVRSGVENR